jgi:hypothetical protein
VAFAQKSVDAAPTRPVAPSTSTVLLVFWEAERPSAFSSAEETRRVEAFDESEASRASAAPAARGTSATAADASTPSAALLARRGVAGASAEASSCASSTLLDFDRAMDANLDEA